MKKVFFSDFDDTLVHYDKDRNGSVWEKDAKAIQKFQEDGNLFGISTGRPKWLGFQIYEMTDGIVKPDFITYSNGCCILDSQGNPIHEVTLEPDLVHQIFEAFPDSCFFVHSLEDKFNLGFEKITAGELMKIAQGDYSHIYSLSFDTNAPDGEKLYEFTAALPGVDSLKNTVYCDVVSKQGGKGKAIDLYKKQFTDGNVKTAAIGDAWNDVSMIEAADAGFTFDYAPEDVQGKADYVVGSIAEAIEILDSME
ncbi:MAG: HAD hydrolase family protein [Erysipelotrichaceae bacterium]|nr:HAD hydrolase family protein [Erysipelotrichaceae bacterium]